jgi:hypothetical protein
VATVLTGAYFDLSAHKGRYGDFSGRHVKYERSEAAGFRSGARRACGAFHADLSLALVSMRRYATQR